VQQTSRYSQSPAVIGNRWDELDVLHRLARYEHPGRALRRYGATVPDALADAVSAALLGCREDQFRETVEILDGVRAATALDLLREPEFREAFDCLPFADTDRVVTVGDSVTADRLGWADLLATALRVGGTGPEQFMNFAVSGHTTSDTIAMFNVIAEARPTWILQMLGTNDARRHGRMTGARMVSPAETARNLHDLQRLVRLETNARLIMITPPPMDATAPVQVVEPTGDRWNAADVEQIAEIVRTMEGTSIDVYTDFAGLDLTALLLPDGIHPSLAGQRAIVTSVVRHLADELFPLADELF
jgi:acyl-CoA thioesterase-1